MKHFLVIIFCIASVMLTFDQAVADSQAGIIKTLTGTAHIQRQGKTFAATWGEKIFKGDTLTTGSDGSLGVILEDDTILCMGPNSELLLSEYVFAPAQGNMSIVTRMLRGTILYVSGIIAKLSPQAVRFETPTAILGIRGTRFLAQVEQ